MGEFSYQNESFVWPPSISAGHLYCSCRKKVVFDIKVQLLDGQTYGRKKIIFLSQELLSYKYDEVLVKCILISPYSVYFSKIKVTTQDCEEALESTVLIVSLDMCQYCVRKADVC